MAGLFGIQLGWVDFLGKAGVQTSIVHGLKEGQLVKVNFVKGDFSGRSEVQAIHLLGPKGIEIKTPSGGGGFGRATSGVFVLEEYVPTPQVIGGSFDEIFNGPTILEDPINPFSNPDEPGREWKIGTSLPVVPPVVADPGDTFGGLNLPGLQWGGLDPRTNAFASNAGKVDQVMAKDSESCECGKNKWLWLALAGVAAWWFWKGRK